MEIGDAVVAVCDLYASEEDLTVTARTAGDVVDLLPDTGKVVVEFDDAVTSGGVIVPGVRMIISPDEVEPLFG